MLKVGTSEDILGLSAQPANTCPLIDDAKQGVDAVDTALLTIDDLLRRYADIDNLPEALDLLEAIADVLSGMQDNTAACLEQFEQIRTRAEEIRQWGNDWKDEAIRRLQVVDPETYDLIQASREIRRGTNPFMQSQESQL